jgi:16S rRNA (cytidine1402-2'-O)-methyltransferase
VPVPGANAAVAAYSAAGFAADRFLFAGFQTARKKNSFEGLDLPWPVIFYEAPHRVLATVNALLEKFGPEREILIARELSKKFEETARMRLAEAPAWLAAGPHRQQGEFVLVLGPGEEKPAELAEGQRVLKILLEKMPAGEAAQLAARITGLPRNALYRSSLNDTK